MKKKIKSQSIAHMRRNYTKDGLLEKDLKTNAIEQFSTWFNDARNSKILQ